MCTYWYLPRKILLSQIKNPKSQVSIIIPKSKILEFKDVVGNSFSYDEENNWDRDLFSYNNINKRRLKRLLKENTKICEDIIKLIVEFIYY